MKFTASIPLKDIPMQNTRRAFLATMITLLPTAAKVQAAGVGAFQLKQQAADKYDGKSTIRFVNNTGLPGIPMIIGPSGYITSSNAVFSNVNTGSYVSSKDTQSSATALGYKNLTGNVVVALNVKYPSARTTDVYYLNFDGTVLSVSKLKIDPPLTA